jgi:DNA-binding protein HU-beta
MPERIQKEAVARQLAERMHTDDQTATRWIDALTETLYERFKAGESVTLKGFGSFYVRPEHESWVFKFTPGQRLRALFGWSSTYKGER